jgi:hypothetical protein
MSYNNLLKLNDVNSLITITQFLSFLELKNLILSCKDIYDNKYIRKDVKIKASNLIYNIFEKYTLIIRDIKEYNEENMINSKRLNAIYYYHYYEKIYIKSLYNINACRWKRDIINQTKKKINNNFLLEIKQKYKDKYTSRLDLFNLIRNMEVKDAMEIGW